MPPLYLLHLSNTSILEQLQLEEALLRVDDRNWCIVNHGSSPAIVMGISGQIHQLIHEEKWKSAPVPIIRRFSGGGTVFVDENTTFITFICNTTFVPVSPFPCQIMRWTEEFYRPLFSPHDFQLQENDYTLGLHKFGGNAQSICKGRWLHHSSLLWDFSPVNMDYLQLPPKMPTYRQQRSHGDFLCRLKNYWSHKEEFHQHLMNQLNIQFNIQEMKREEVWKITQEPHRKATIQLK